MDELWDRRVEHRKAGRPIKATGEEECLFNSALTLFDYMIASIAVDLRIGQLVDVPNVGVTVILPLDILSVVLSAYNSSYNSFYSKNFGCEPRCRYLPVNIDLGSRSRIRMPSSFYNMHYKQITANRCVFFIAIGRHIPFSAPTSVSGISRSLLLLKMFVSLSLGAETWSREFT